MHDTACIATYAVPFMPPSLHCMCIPSSLSRSTHRVYTALAELSQIANTCAACVRVSFSRQIFFHHTNFIEFKQCFVSFTNYELIVCYRNECHKCVHIDCMQSYTRSSRLGTKWPDCVCRLQRNCSAASEGKQSAKSLSFFFGNSSISI